MCTCYKRRQKIISMRRILPSHGSKTTHEQKKNDHLAIVEKDVMHPPGAGEVVRQMFDDVGEE
jgi:hypothetical protein